MAVPFIYIVPMNAFIQFFFNFFGLVALFLDPADGLKANCRMINRLTTTVSAAMVL